MGDIWGNMERKILKEKEPLTLIWIDTDTEEEYKQRIRIQEKPEIGIRDDQEKCKAIGSGRNLGESMDFLNHEK